MTSSGTEANGRWSEVFGTYSWWDVLHYDDITHEGVIHHAYMLRMFEHAREMIVSSDHLANVYALEDRMYVTTDSSQKHFVNSKIKELTVIGNYINVRTKIIIEGNYRMRFAHELYLFKTMDPSGNSPSALTCSGYVDMVTLNTKTLQVGTLPTSLARSTIHSLENFTKGRVLLSRNEMITPPCSTAFAWKVSKFDTDFTEVVYQAKYLQYYENCRLESMPQILQSLGIRSDLGAAGLQFQVQRADAHFKEGAMYGDVVEVSVVGFRKEGRFKIVVFQEMHKNGKLINSAEIELICLHSESNKLSALPC